MKVLFAAAECAPFFKSGGLGDVVGSLPKELVQNGADVRVVLPFHTIMPQVYKDMLQDLGQFTVRMGWKERFCGIKQLELEGVTYYFVDNLQYFDRPSLYGFEDDGERFSFFSMAAIELMEKVDFIPDVLHAHDWHTAIIPVLLKDKYHWISAYSDIKTVLTIHNLQFQGRFGQEVLGDWLGIGYNAYHDHGLQYYDDVNFFKGGMYYADFVTTVSPNYANEIQTPEFGFGLDGVLRDINYKLTGILNGIDYEANNPSIDKRINSNFDRESIDQKAPNKAYLQEKLGLEVRDDILLIGVVSRLTDQKGFGLVEYIMDELMTRPVQVALLGTGDEKFENSFKHFNWAYPGKHVAVLDFDTTLAQEIYAGADLFLMPSAFEPCGLSQMISMRYGTLPLVHEIGGLKDTVQPYNQFDVTGTGFTFNGFTPANLMNKIDEALGVYYDYPDNWRSVQYQAMSQDNSWKNSASHYIDLYNKLSF